MNALCVNEIERNRQFVCGEGGSQPNAISDLGIMKYGKKIGRREDKEERGEERWKMEIEKRDKNREFVLKTWSHEHLKWQNFAAKSCPSIGIIASRRFTYRGEA